MGIFIEYRKNPLKSAVISAFSSENFFHLDFFFLLLQLSEFVWVLGEGGGVGEVWGKET